MGSAGDSDRIAVLKVRNAEEFSRAELRAFSRLAKARRLYLQEKHESLSLHFLLREDAAILKRWIDDVRRELARQPSLGLAANDVATGSARAATPRALRPDTSTGPPLGARAGPATVRADPPTDPDALALASNAMQRLRELPKRG